MRPRLNKRPSDFKVDSLGDRALNGLSVSVTKHGRCQVRTGALVHRLIWENVYGKAPKIIDHINRNPKDNRFCNLRAATRKLNQMNSVSRSQCGLPKGVSPDPNGWYKARLCDTCLGWFKTPEEAAAAYKGAAAILILEEQLKAEKEWLYG